MKKKNTLVYGSPDLPNKHLVLADKLDDMQFDHMLSFESILEAFQKVRNDTLEEAARIAEAFPATDAFDKLDPCCYCEGVAKFIRAGIKKDEK